jgi:hypothetical protein
MPMSKAHSVPSPPLAVDFPAPKFLPKIPASNRVQQGLQALTRSDKPRQASKKIRKQALFIKPCLQAVIPYRRKRSHEFLLAAKTDFGS